MYQDFAYVYDKLMADVPYDDWAAFYQRAFRRFGAQPSLVLDLGCGTGTLTARLADLGYDMIGVDASGEMLSVAKQKLPAALFLQQDMASFELYGTVDAIVSALDSMNYLTDEGDLQTCFSLCRNYLNPGGLFIFDMNSPYKLSSLLGNHTFVEEGEDYFYTWENEFDKESKICDFYLNIFMRRGKTYERIEEFQQERAYETHEVEALLAKAGLRLLTVTGGTRFSPPGKKSERLFFVAQKEN